MNLANKLTILRILLVPIIVIIPFFNINGEFLNIPITNWIIVTIFIIASITDKLDGHIARSMNQITTFGKFLDPIADKILVISAMLILVEMNHLPAWIPIIVIMREFIVSGYRLIAVQKGGNVIAANIWGKLKTVTQILAIIATFLDNNSFVAFISHNLSGFGLYFNIFTSMLMIISVIATILSGWSYIKNGKELFKN